MPKLSVDDPRLKLRSHGTRQLRKGPILVVAMLLASAASASVVMVADPEKRAPAPAAPPALRPAEVPRSLRQPTPPPTPAPEAPAAVVERLPVVPVAAVAPVEVAEPDLPTVPGERGIAADPRTRAEKADDSLLAEINEMPETPAEEGFAIRRQGELADQAHPARGGPIEADAPDLGDDPNHQRRKNAFLRSGQSGDGYLAAALQSPRSPYELKAGSIIPAVMITAINSDLPGTVVARVREEVCDSVSGEYSLIPSNSTLVGRYDSMVVWGQERVLFCWDRLTLPNGDSIGLECMPAADHIGQSGLTGDVDHHWWRIVKGALLASLFAAGASAAAGDTTGYEPTIAQKVVRGGAAEVARAGEAVTAKNLNLQPTIRVPAGTAFNVMVTKDMILKRGATRCGGDR